MPVAEYVPTDRAASASSAGAFVCCTLHLGQDRRVHELVMSHRQSDRTGLHPRRTAINTFFLLSATDGITRSILGPSIHGRQMLSSMGMRRTYTRCPNDEGHVPPQIAHPGTDPFISPLPLSPLGRAMRAPTGVLAVRHADDSRPFGGRAILLSTRPIRRS